MTTPLLEFNNLCVLGEKNPAHIRKNQSPYILYAINFSMLKGQMLAVIGPNGAGKSTLIKALLNLIPYQADKAHIEGHLARTLSDNARAKILSYVPQSIALMNDISVYEWCEMARFSHQSFGFSLSLKDKDAIKYAIDMCDLNDLQNVSLNCLSGGERQRALIAGALAQEAKIIVLDEPTSHLDPAHATEILSLLRQLNQECGQTIICVSHDINQVYQYFDFVYALKQGACEFFGATKDMINKSSLCRLYGQEFIEIAYANTKLYLPNMVNHEK